MEWMMYCVELCWFEVTSSCYSCGWIFSYSQSNNNT